MFSTCYSIYRDKGQAQKKKKRNLKKVLTTYPKHGIIKITNKRGIDNYEQIRNRKRHSNGVHPNDG